MRKKSDKNKRSHVPRSKTWTSIQTSKEKRVMNFRISRDLDALFKRAVLKTQHTQTEIIISLIEAYVKYAEYHNSKLDKTIDDLMEQRENNERKVIASSLDEAINKLKNKSN